MQKDKLQQLCRKYGAHLISSEPRIVIAVMETAPHELLATMRFSSDKPIDVEYWSAAQFERHQQHQQEEQTETSALSATDRINQTLHEALRQRASDIHFEPDSTNFRVRFRIDGVLHLQYQADIKHYAAIVARFKVLANLDLAEKRLPQDGQFTPEAATKGISYRVATLPCLDGEKVVLRVLQQPGDALALTSLGLMPRQHQDFIHALQCPQGLILVTGPTGSGKTVSLYSALAELNHPDVNICSVEDPVEIPLTGLNQSQVNTKAGLSFQRVLRALLRQDPDIIMVGEIRDGETAEIAIKAAQTGHLVLSTLHTNSTVETVIRLQQMGIARWMIASALTLVIAQRLVRKLCPHCRHKQSTPLHLPASLCSSPLPDWSAPGCEHCYSGFYGRIALFEVLWISEPLRQAIAQEMPAEQMARIASEQGVMTLFEHGCKAVEAGETTLSEVYRVLGIPNG